MPYLTVGNENSQDIKLHFRDHGQGEPVVLIHGYPFSGTAWEKQEATLLDAGYRVITYDRRGFGLSSQPSIGYNYDTFADDLQILMTELDLQGVTLVGHSMGTGEITRYLSTFGSKRVSRAVFISPIPPFLLKTDDNPTGVDQKVFDQMKEDIQKDRASFLGGFIKKFYNADKLLEKSVSDEKMRTDFILGSSASPIATYASVSSWLTDFRRDLPKIDVPCLVIQGDADQVLPIKATGALLAKALNVQLVKIEGGAHGIPWTHADQISDEILGFIGGSQARTGAGLAKEGLKPQRHV